MNTSMQVFKNDRFGEVRVVEIEGIPYFVGNDVAKALGYEKPRNAIAQHVDIQDALKRGIPDNQGFNQETIIINESGMYSLVFGSKLETAKEFKRWVTSEVLPSVRKHGGYLTPQKIEEALLDPDTIIQLATSLKEERAKREVAERQIEAQRPAVVFHDSVTASNTVITVSELAKLICQNGIDIGEKGLYEWLVENKYLMRSQRWSNSRNRYENDYMLYQRFVEMGLFFVTENVIQGAKEPFVKHTVKVAGKGQSYFINKFLNAA